jgi:hypothetical protein
MLHKTKKFNKKAKKAKSKKRASSITESKSVLHLARQWESFIQLPD